MAQKLRSLAALVAVALCGMAVVASPASAAAPVNDDFADAIALVGQAGQISGSTVDATWESGEPCDFVGWEDPAWKCGPSVWYQWTPDPLDTSSAIFSLCGSSYDTTLQVFTGASLSGLNEVAANDDGCGAFSQVEFVPVAGTDYWIRVSGYNGNFGAFTLAYPASAPSDTTAPTVTCSANPSGVKANSHKLTSITTSVTVTDEVDGSGAAGFELVSVQSSQADSGLAGDDQPDDIQGWTTSTPDTIGQLRAERYGSQRVYTLTYEGSDVDGNTASCQTTVTIEKGK